MNLKFVLKEELNNEQCYELDEIEDKKVKEQKKEFYSNVIIEAIQTGKTKIYFEAKEILNDKNIIKLTTEALAEALFDIGWYFDDNNIDDSNFNIVIISDDENCLELYKKACKEMGFVL